MIVTVTSAMVNGVRIVIIITIILKVFIYSYNNYYYNKNIEIMININNELGELQQNKNTSNYD